MMPTSEEQDRPHEWILRIVEGREYGALVDDAGDLALAAYRLARALCRIRPVPTSVPTLREIAAAAAEIADACGMFVPSGTSLVEACEAAGFVVIEPVFRVVQKRAVPTFGARKSAYAF
jgi:hypothetical protein